jgi:hypothetical protein
MKNNRRFWFGFVALVAFSAAPAVQAFDGFCGGPFLGQSTAYGVSGNLYGLGIVPAPPYFALHPPVYYGERYFRSYGESPFARPDFSSRPKRIEAQVIINPFLTPAMVPSKVEPPKAQTVEPQSVEKVTSAPQMIINPFYQPEEKIAFGTGSQR